MNTETRHRDVDQTESSKGELVKRIKLALALGMSVAALANQGCDRAAPLFSQSGPASETGRSLLSRVADRLSLKKGEQISLRIDLYAAVLPGRPFRVEVSYRNPAGDLLDVSDKTIWTHRCRAFQKLGVQGLADLFRLVSPRTSVLGPRSSVLGSHMNLASHPRTED